ncbi:enoyl-CoA hydratase/isomerase family protein [Tessaracoccus coleopterorum]|uniref:enoyl-CoA hydratase/isomerase family protein n=1 Tax=Tessaracoccus coleopterorum TaxID=2714950 RepID=UPI0018D4B426|nr:enoyl-CoA hydratase/isomerase family protein [Tessaracoccus coleopterorum]
MVQGGEAVGGGVEELAGVINNGITALVASSVPVVAAVQGTAVGGGLGILLSSDYAVGAVDARIGSLYADMGLTPDLSVTAHLSRAVGERRALQLTLTSRLLSADEALDWGFSPRSATRSRCEPGRSPSPAASSRARPGPTGRPSG